jgi:predicted permease
MKQLWRRFRWFVHRDAFERELDEEMRHHLALKAQEQGGVRTAHRQFGNVTLWKENSRIMWTGRFWEQVAQDLRYGLRAMKANKLFTALATISLALGIGANTAIYSFMDAIMIRALPVQKPEELVLLNWRVKGHSAVVSDHDGSSYTEGGSEVSPDFPYHAFEFLRDKNRVFANLFAFAHADRFNLVVNGEAQLGDGEYVSGGYFGGLGVRPALGRLIGPEDDGPSSASVVTISYSFWQTRFAGRDDAVGKSIAINGKPFTITGVSPPEFFGVRPNYAPQVFIPIRDLPVVDLNRFQDAKTRFTNDHSYWVDMMGRLRPGVTLADAQAEMSALFAHWVSDTARNAKDRASLPKLWLEEGGSGVDALRRQYSKPLFILMTMVALILAIACANIANLLLSRAASRRREMAVRLSLGAGRLRIVRQLLTESILLAICGGLLGMFIAAIGIRFLTLLLANGREDFTLHAVLDWRVLFFALLVAFVTGLLFGLAPAIQATKVDVTPALKETRASASRGRTRRFGLPFGLSHILLVSQVTICLLLVAAAGLFVRTLGNLNSVALGFNRQNLLLFSLDAAEAGYHGSALKNFYAELQRRFRLIPGVRNATLTQMPLVSESWSSTDVHIPGVPEVNQEGRETTVLNIGPGFFTTMQIPLLAGRSVDDRDRESAPAVVVINEVFAKKYFPGTYPIGRHFKLGDDGRYASELQIVGVAKSARYNSLKGDIPPVAYVPYLQVGNNGIQQMYFELRTTGNPLALANTVRRIVHDVGPRVPVADVSTQSQIIDQTISEEETFAALCTCFGALALLIACVGLYASTAYAVARRTNEIGIRMALGAVRRRILWMVVSEALIVGAAGLALGLAAVWEMTAFLKSFLYGLKPHDPTTFAASIAILMAATILAGYVPARRASRIDPMTALRHE